MESLPHIPEFPSDLLHQRVMPPLTNRISPIEKPLRHLIRTPPPPMRYNLFSLHIFEPCLLEVFLDQLRS